MLSEDGIDKCGRRRAGTGRGWEDYWAAVAIILGQVLGVRTRTRQWEVADGRFPCSPASKTP